MSRVAVLKGGRSLERQVSLRSGARDFVVKQFAVYSSRLSGLAGMRS